MNVRWRKVAADLGVYRAQLALVALVLVLGAAGIVAALDAQTVLKRETLTSYQAAASHDVVLWFEHIDAELLTAVAKHDDVAAVAVRRSTHTRVALTDGSWLSMRLIITPTIHTQAVSRVHSHSAKVGSDDSNGMDAPTRKRHRSAKVEVSATT